MWIPNHILAKFLSGEDEKFWRGILASEFEIAMKREEERRRIEIEMRNAFLTKVCEVLATSSADKPCYPTEVQFAYFAHTGKQVSCAKIAAAFRILVNYRKYPDIPENLKNHLAWNGREDNHSYYIWRT